MGFLLQLRILLWKNFTLKKRSPFVVLFEIILPLVLFIILLMIRRKQPAYPVKATNYWAYPLPSAGILPIMQLFCSSSYQDKNGFIKFPDNHIRTMLEDIQDVSSNNNFFEPGFTVDKLNDLPQLYRDVIEDPAAVSHVFFHVQNISISDLLINRTLLKDELVSNFSMSPDSVDAIFNSQINFTEINRLLYDYGVIETVSQERSRSRRSIIERLHINKTKSIEKMKKLRKNLKIIYHSENKSKDKPKWMKLLWHDRFLKDPQIMKVAMVFLGFGTLNDLDPDLISDVVETIILDPDNMKLLICDNNEELKRLIILPADNNGTLLEDTKHSRLCNMTHEQWTHFSDLIKDDINSTMIADNLSLEQINITNAQNRVDKFNKNFREFIDFQTNLVILSNLADRLPNDACPLPLIVKTTPTPPLPAFSLVGGDYAFGITELAPAAASTNTNTTFEPSHEDDYKDDKNADHDSSKTKEGKPKRRAPPTSGLVRIWLAMQTTVCGQPEIPKSKRDSMTLDDLSLTYKQKHDLGILFHTLYSNPRILYSPNNTEIDRVIDKANGIFKLMKQITDYSKNWLNISTNIKSYLSEPRTVNNLNSIRQMQYELRHLKGAADLISDPKIRQFIKNGTVPTADEMKQQLITIDNAACSWQNLVTGIDFNIFKGFANEEDLVDYFLHSAQKDHVTILSSVVFENIHNNSLPPHVVYKLRQNASFVHSTRLVREKFWHPGPTNWGYNYYEFGFVWIQDVIERAIIDIQTNKTVVQPGSYLHQMPYPCYTMDQFLFMIEHVMPMCLTISWVYTVAMLVQNIVYEKEQRLKEVMKIMGLSNSVHWMAWFITSIVQMIVTMATLTAMLKYGGILAYSSVVLLFTVLMLFGIATISFSFLISACYSKAKLAAACAGIIYFITYVPYMYVAIREEAAGDHIPAWMKSLASLFSTTAFGLGSKYFAYYEIEGVGVQWWNLHLSPVESDRYNLAYVMAMLVFDTCLYGLLTWYIENVNPGTYGLPKPLYFPFTKSYWFGQSVSCEYSLWSLLIGRHNEFRVMEEEQQNVVTGEPGTMETEPRYLKIGLSIENLVKKYKSGKIAVNDLNLNLYQGQITSLLGHNGAGKTTTMSILTGLFPATRGTAKIGGHDIRTDMHKIRKSLGMCPQHNVLFDKLTLEEHLWLYARLKGCNNKDIKQEMDRIIEDIGMPDKRHCTVDRLSGGMKRKLSVAMAFVGNSSTIILDEPTAGVDPFARRDIWELILKYKKGRTIMLSTHHMDESDILSDRIAIISAGKLKCCGSSLFLKSRYGEGYHLKATKQPIVMPDLLRDEDNNHDDDDELLDQDKFKSSCSTRKVTQFLRTYMSSCYLKSETKHELHYILPFDEVKKGNFEKLFDALDNNLAVLHLSSYGVVDTSLEEVFLKVTEIAEQKQKEEKEPDDVPLLSNINDNVEMNDLFNGPATFVRTHRRQFSTLSNESQHSNDSAGNVSLSEFKYTGINAKAVNNGSSSPEDDEIDQLLPSGNERVTQFFLLAWQQYIAILVKRFHFVRRNWKGLFTQILLPAMFVSIAMTVALAAPSSQDLPEMVLSPAQYYNSTQPRGNFMPFSNIADPTLSGNDFREYAPWHHEADSARLVETFTYPSGVAATCVLKTPFNSPFDLDKLRTMNGTHTRDLLVKTYFEASCESVFVKGLRLTNFVPPEINSPSSFVNTTINNKTKVEYTSLYYPECSCAADGSGQICSKSGFLTPDTIQLVTSDYLQEITGDNDQDYYLSTANIYRLHRYGGFAFGLKRDIVPEHFGYNTSDLYKKIAVRHAVQVWYNHKGLHAMPTYLNSINNAILRANLPKHKGDPAGYGITLISHPMKGTNNKLSMDYILAGSDVLIAIFIICAMSFVPASFVLFLVYEKSIKAKHLQTISGLNRIVYWIANYSWDICNFLVPITCCVLILKIFGIPAYVSSTNFPAVVGLFLLYGWSITPIMYPASFLFNEPSTAYVCLIVSNLFIGITCIITSFMLEMFSINDKELQRTHELLKTVFLLFPNYCLGRGLMDIAFNEYHNDYYFKSGQYDKMRSPFEWNLTLRNMFAMMIMGIVFFIITILIEFRFFIKIRVKQRKNIQAPAEEDVDVRAERKRVSSGYAHNDILRIENLSKEYKTYKMGKYLATDRLNLGVPKGECFGLLGVNGAGKSTTFKMLTGDLSPSLGNAFLNGHSVISSLNCAQSNLGYCAQFDSLYDDLTAREHLLFYSRLRGIPPKHQTQVVEWALLKLGLGSYADDCSCTYSGGTKRKLSTAIALIGAPPILFLDEPTTGMDPYSRRFLWDLILRLVKQGKSVILTSHSMEECEVLCSRMAIMVAGRFRCLGSAQHLKQRFGDGYTFTLKVRNTTRVKAASEFVNLKFPESSLKEIHHNTLKYEILHVKLGSMFAELERALKQDIIDDYSINQNTLDNVFINFVKQESATSINHLNADVNQFTSDNDDVSLLDLDIIHSSEDTLIRDNGRLIMNTVYS